MNIAMMGGRNWKWTLVGAVALIGLLVWAWIDGGREPVRPIVQPVAVPELPR